MGLQDRIDRLTPDIVTLPSSIKKIENIACGYEHTLLVTSNGDVWASGSGEQGQLGLESKGSVTMFTQIDSLKNISQIACGYYHSVALTVHGDVLTWGNGGHGELGHGDCEVN